MRRTRPRVAAALLVMLGAVLVAFGGAFTWQHRADVDRWLEDHTGETARPQQINALLWHLAQRETRTADEVPVRWAGVYPYGANTFFEQEVEEWKLRRSMEMLRSIGVRWIRQQMPWDRIEIPAKGRYDSPFGGSSWDSYDRFIRLANEYGLEIVARLDLPPEWARRDPFPWEERTLPQAAPRNFADYFDFVETFVRRYRGQIRFFQIWNEPNLYSDWGDAIDASAYARLLCGAAARARAANPDAVIISAAIAATAGTPDGYHQDDLSFLNQLYDAGAAPCFDILATQGHGLWTGPAHPRASPTETNFARLRLVREIMVARGDAHKAIWVSELGWNAQPMDHPKPPSHGRVTPEQQARYTVQAYRRAQREWPWVGVLFYWHFRRVHEENRDDVDFYYRMVDPDFTTHPVYHAYAAMTAQAPVSGIGFHNEDHWALRYSGTWTEQRAAGAGLGAVRVADAAGAGLEFEFEGTELQLAQLASRDGGRARFAVRNSSGREVAAGFVEFRAGAPSPRIVVLAERLPRDRYSLILTVDQPPIAIDGFIVRDNPLAVLGPPLAFVLLAGAAGVIMLYALMARRSTA